MTKNNILTNADLAEAYYNQLGDDFNHRDGVPADAEDWERWFGACMFFAQEALLDEGLGI
jgi:hypothetical protein